MLTEEQVDILERWIGMLMPAVPAAKQLCADWRELKKVVDSLSTRTLKLAKMGKPFLVVSLTEDYFPLVYEMIRHSEMKAGTWTRRDALQFADLMQAHYLPRDEDRWGGQPEDDVVPPVESEDSQP